MMQPQEYCKECGRPIGKKYGGTYILDLSGRNIADVDPRLIRQIARYQDKGRKVPEHLLEQLAEQSVFWLCDEHMEEHKQRYFTPSQIEQMDNADSKIIIAPIEKEVE